MGCGKSKHDVVAATTVVKSMRSDSKNETLTTKKVTEKADSVVVQQEVETKSLVVENNTKENVATKKDIQDDKTDNVGPTLQEDVVSVTKVVKEDEKVKDSKPAETETKSDDLVPVLSENVVAVAGVVKEDKEDKDCNPTDTTDVKTENVDSDEMGATKVVKDDLEGKDSNEESSESVISKENVEKTVDDSSDLKEESPKIEEQMDVVPAEELTKEETKKEEVVEVTGENIVNAKTLPTAEPEKVPIVDEATTVETEEKESETK